MSLGRFWGLGVLREPGVRMSWGIGGPWGVLEHPWSSGSLQRPGCPKGPWGLGCPWPFLGVGELWREQVIGCPRGQGVL